MKGFFTKDTKATSLGLLLIKNKEENNRITHQTSKIIMMIIFAK